jgi:hypothetical protein
MERARARVTAALYRRSRVAFELQGAAKKRRAPSEPVPRRGWRAQQARPGHRPAARRAAGMRTPLRGATRVHGRRAPARPSIGLGGTLVVVFCCVQIWVRRVTPRRLRAPLTPRVPRCSRCALAARCQGAARRAPRQRKRYGCRPACGRSARGAQRERWLPRRGGSGGASCGARGRCGAARRAASPAAPAAQPQPAAAAQPAACAGAAASAACARRLCV